MQNLISWKIGGEQGQGIDSSGDLFATVWNRLGYYVYGYKEFSSRIKGRAQQLQDRVGDGAGWRRRRTTSTSW